MIQESTLAEPVPLKTEQSHQTEREQWEAIKKDTKSSKKAHKFYLKTKHWRARRLEILERDNHQCQACGDTKSLHVHHKRYNHLWAERDDDLITLCEECHRTTHHYGKLSRIRKKDGTKIKLNKKKQPKRVTKKEKKKFKKLSKKDKIKVGANRTQHKYANSTRFYCQNIVNNKLIVGVRPTFISQVVWDIFVKEYQTSGKLSDFLN